MLSLPLARWAMKNLRRSVAHPMKAQHAVLQSLLSAASTTAFGRDHGLTTGMSVPEFQRAIPVRDYEGLRGYMDRAVEGEANVVWPGKPLYFCKTSGTTSGAAHSLDKDSMPTTLAAPEMPCWVTSLAQARHRLWTEK